MASQFYNRAARFALQSLKAPNCLRVSPPSQLLARSSNPLQLQQVAYISTSKKDGETITSEITTTHKEAKTESETKTKHWVSLGFEWDNEDSDRNSANLVFFSTVTLGLVGIGFALMYFPDHQLSNWSQREAYIELARREALGLPLIDPDLVPAENVHLPTEEELGDFEIII